MRSTFVVTFIALITSAVLLAAVGDMIREEFRTRLDRLPYLLIRLARLWLPRQSRPEYTEEWTAELAFFLHGTDDLPVTRFLKGITYAADILLRGAPLTSCEIGDPPWLRARARLSGRTGGYFISANCLLVTAGVGFLVGGVTATNFFVLFVGIALIADVVVQIGGRRLAISSLIMEGLAWLGAGLAMGGWYAVWCCTFAALFPAMEGLGLKARLRKLPCDSSSR